LRDDINCLFQKLPPLYKKKTALINRLITSQADIRPILKTGNTEKISDLIDSDENMFDQIREIDFNISLTFDEICRKSGMSEQQIKKHIAASHNEILKDIKKRKNELSHLTRTLAELKKENIILLENFSNDLNTSIDEISQIRRIKWKSLIQEDIENTD